MKNNDNDTMISSEEIIFIVQNIIKEIKGFKWEEGFSALSPEINACQLAKLKYNLAPNERIDINGELKGNASKLSQYTKPLERFVDTSKLNKLYANTADRVSGKYVDQENLRMGLSNNLCIEFMRNIEDISLILKNQEPKVSKDFSKLLASSLQADIPTKTLTKYGISSEELFDTKAGDTENYTLHSNRISVISDFISEAIQGTILTFQTKQHSAAARRGGNIEAKENKSFTTKEIARSASSSSDQGRQ